MVDHTVNGTKMTTTVSTVDDLLRARAAEEDQRPVVAYPKSNHGHNDHELFTAKQLHHFTNAAVRSCVASDICPVVSPDPHKRNNSAPGQYEELSCSSMTIRQCLLSWASQTSIT